MKVERTFANILEQLEGEQGRLHVDLKKSISIK
jgi:hypothetical protein